MVEEWRKRETEWWVDAVFAGFVRLFWRGPVVGGFGFGFGEKVGDADAASNDES